MSDVKITQVKAADLAAPGAVAKPTPPVPAETEDYKVGMWHGKYPNYECKKCQYATLYIDKMNKHIAENIHDWAHPGGPSEFDPARVTGEPELEY